MRLLIPAFFVAFFFGWLFYRLLVTRDLKDHLAVVYVGFFFIGIWLMIYYWIFS